MAERKHIKRFNESDEPIEDLNIVDEMKKMFGVL